MAVVEAVLAEVAKVGATHLLTGVVKGGQLICDRLRGKLGTLPEDRETLLAAITARAEREPDWIRELAADLAGLGGGGSASWARIAPDPFCDRESFLERPPLDGVYLVAGNPGVGRGALVRRLAESQADRFPHGCVDLDLDDFGYGEELTDAVRRAILSALGVPSHDLAEATTELREQYRTVTARHSFVLILRNVRGLSQVEPYESSPVNLILATTDTLTGDLRAKYRSHTTLGGLDPAGAWQLLAARCGGGADRDGDAMLDAEPEPTAALLALCGHVPYVIECVGAELGRRYGEPEPVSALLLEYCEAGVTGADELLTEWVRRSWQRLDDKVATDTALLAEHPGPDFTPPTATALLGHPARETIGQLQDRGLLLSDGAGRYRLLEPIRGHAARLDIVSAADRADAFTRVAIFYAEHAMLADLAENPNRLRGYQAPGGLTWRVDGKPRTDWVAAESQVIAALVPRAHRAGLHEQLCQLVGAFEPVMNKIGDRRRYAALNEWRIRSAGAPELLVRAHGMHARLNTLFRFFPAAHQSLLEADRLLPQARGTEFERARLHSSTQEMWGRFFEEQGDVAQLAGQGAAGFLGHAMDRFGHCVQLDQRISDGRALGIHARMLARVLRKAGRSAEALPYLDVAVGNSAGANLGAAHLVAAGVLLDLGRNAEAREQLDLAGQVLAAQGATQYRWEFAETEARLETVAGKRKKAAELWDALINEAFQAGHPRANEYWAQRWGSARR